MGDPNSSRQIGFKNIHLFNDQLLGIGSYGKVCKAECDGLLCAAKLIHQTLCNPTVVLQRSDTSLKEHRLPMKRFLQECNFLSTIRHPKIIQYLGFYQDPATNLPVLLMELMEQSLTHFLEKSSQAVAYHTQVNICHDITLALSFLHSNGIYHRDLSSNNVLLTGNIRAKVTDFGMARLCDLRSQTPHPSLTTCPGTDVYMPPEAVKEKPVYTEKIDCFSFGVITLQIMTRLFPSPGDRRKEVETEELGLVEKMISERERRQNHISQVDSAHPLLTIVLDCLNDKDVERPAAQELCKRAASLKRDLKYSESIRVDSDNSTLLGEKSDGDNEKGIQIRSSNQLIDSLRDLQAQIVKYEETIKQKDMIIAAELIEIQKLKEQCQIQDSERDKEVAEVKKQLKEADKYIKEYKSQLGKIDESQAFKTLTLTRVETVAKISLKWREGENAPHVMSRNLFSMVDVAVDGDVIYVMENHHVYAYDTVEYSWSQLPDCTFRSCPSAIVNNLLTLIGGIRGDIITNKLFSLTKKGKNLRWTEEFPQSMPTNRWGASALSTGTDLIVAGGTGSGGDIVATTEVMDTETYQWSIAADLPQPMHYGSLLQISENRLYMLGGIDGSMKPIQSVYTCSLNALRQTCSRKRLVRFFKGSDVWSRVTDIPVIHSTYVCAGGRLLAIGGLDSQEKTSNAIHAYNPSNKSWDIVSHMSTPRQNCYVALLPDNQLIVVGGKTQMFGHETDKVEIASLL